MAWKRDKIIQLFLEPDAKRRCICTLRGVSGEQYGSKFDVPDDSDSVAQATIEAMRPPGRHRLQVTVPDVGILPRDMKWQELLDSALPDHMDQLIAPSEP